MIPMAAPATQYQYVFQSADFSWGLYLPVGMFGATIVTSLMLFAFTSSKLLDENRAGRSKEYLRRRTTLAILACGFFVAFGVSIAYDQHLTNASQNAMTENVQNKYGAHLEFPDSTVESVNGIDQPKPYTLIFPDKTKGTYTIRFDRMTSEPFITEGGSPSAQELNQKAGK